MTDRLNMLRNSKLPYLNYNFKCILYADTTTIKQVSLIFYKMLVYFNFL
jgi:hypothetical protein